MPKYNEEIENKVGE